MDRTISHHFTLQNVMAEKNQCSALQPCTQLLHHFALQGIKYQGDAHSEHGSNFTAQNKEQIYQLNVKYLIKQMRALVHITLADC